MGRILLQPRSPAQVLFMLVIMGTGALVLAKTRFGSHIYATGGNLEAAQNTGINTNRLKLICFALTGGLSAIAGILLFARLGMAPGDTGSGFELQVIAGIIIGGVGLFGGRGNIFCAFIGILFSVILSSGLILLGV